MPTTLQLAGKVQPSLQPIQDDEGDPSALLISTQNVQVIGVPPSLGCHLQFGNPQANTTSNQPSASLTFSGWGIQHAGFVWTPSQSVPGSLKLAFGPNDDPDQNTPQFIFHGDGAVAFRGLGKRLHPNTSADLRINSKGNITPESSSLRFKEQVKPLNEDFQKILALQPKSFTYKETGARGIGYAAEELDELELNDLVGYDIDGKPLTINYKLIPVYLLEVLKEQQKTIQELQAQVAQLNVAKGASSQKVVET